MFDTIILSRAYRHQPPREVQDYFTAIGDRYVYNPLPKGGRTLPALTWSTAPDGIAYLRAQVSLPKKLFGNNIIMVFETDIPRALDEISDFASERAGVDFDARAANIVRIDFCHNWYVGIAGTYEYLFALRNATIPRMVRRVIDDSTVDFSNHSQKVSIYSKHDETKKLAEQRKATDADVRASVGVLRLEHRFTTSNACKRLATRLGLPDRRAHDILRDHVATTVLGEAMTKLGLNEHIESGDSRFALIREKYGFGTIYERLVGFIGLCDEHGAENLIRLGYDKETFRRRRKELEAAGAWLTNPSRRTLHPLRLVQQRSAERSSFGG